MNLRKLLLATLLPGALTGCNEAIDTVKSARMAINDQYTVDEAFSNRDICNSVDWEVVTDDRRRELVQYTCHIADIETYYENEWQRQKNYLVHELESKQPQIKPFLDGERQELESAERALNAPPSINRAPLESDRLAELQSLSEMLDENPPSRALQNYSNIPIVKELAELSRRYHAGYVRDPADRQFAAHKQNENALRQAIEATRPQVQAAIEEERARLANVQQARDSDSAAYTQQRVSKAREAIEKLERQYETQLAELEADRVNTLAGFENAATIESVAEIFQWVVKDEEIELVWSGLEGTYSDGQVNKFDHANRLGSLRDVYSNTAKTYREMRQKAPLM
jgi:hypothetical protein